MLLPGSTIGVLGGGQLGRMLAMEARRMGYRVRALDPDPANKWSESCALWSSFPVAWVAKIFLGKLLPKPLTLQIRIN